MDLIFNAASDQFSHPELEILKVTKPPRAWNQKKCQIQQPLHIWMIKLNFGWSKCRMRMRLFRPSFEIGARFLIVKNPGLQFQWKSISLQIKFHHIAMSLISIHKQYEMWLKTKIVSAVLICWNFVLSSLFADIFQLSSFTDLKTLPTLEICWIDANSQV